MIVDHVSRAEQYFSLSPGIAAALRYLATTDFTQVEPGKHALDGDRLIAIVQRYRTKAAADAVWESHRRYIDVQYIAVGEEHFGYRFLDEHPRITRPYDSEKEAQFYEPGGSSLAVTAGTFMIFFPHDIHSPSWSPTPGNEVLKVVMKVAIDD